MGLLPGFLSLDQRPQPLPGNLLFFPTRPNPAPLRRLALCPTRPRRQPPTPCPINFGARSPNTKVFRARPAISWWRPRVAMSPTRRARAISTPWPGSTSSTGLALPSSDPAFFRLLVQFLASAARVAHQHPTPSAAAADVDDGPSRAEQAGARAEHRSQLSIHSERKVTRALSSGKGGVPPPALCRRGAI